VILQSTANDAGSIHILQICQLYLLREIYDNSFGIVISPRDEGLKLLYVHLTDRGFAKINKYNRTYMGQETSGEGQGEVQGEIQGQRQGQGQRQRREQDRD